MKFKRFLLFIVATVVIGWMGIQLLSYRDRLKNPGRVAFILNIPEPPRSVRNIECSSTAVTDLVVTCAFEVDPEDFDKLVTGWPFTKESATGTSWRPGYDAHVGPEFDVDIRYRLNPAEFKYGGEVSLVGNQDRSLVVANRYEE